MKNQTKNMKKIGIIGSGVVGQTLASGFLKHGYDVMIGTREPAKLEEWKKKTGGKGMVGTFDQAAQFGDILVLSVKGTEADKALHLAGVSHLNGKTIIDTTNPIANAAPVNGVLQFFTEMNGSLMEKLQAEFPQAHFVKAFNSVGSAFMVNPPMEKPSMFICGNNDEAKNEVKNILEQFGWETEDMGKAEAARAIEPLCMLWCIPGFLKGQWTHAFKLIKI